MLKKLYSSVLIVAKCIVNYKLKWASDIECEGINSSKVYCKCIN